MPPGNSLPPVNNFDLPIALRKDVRYCVQYPIANYVSYSALSPFTRFFSIALSSISTPNSVSESFVSTLVKGYHGIRDAGF